jgi:O-antigen/teichoic acid export membrane protein
VLELSMLKHRVDTIGQNPLVKNTLWMLLAHGGRLVLQIAYFVIVARTLGAEQYGAFVGATSLVSTLAPFATLGAGNLLVKNVSRDRTLFQDYWGNALLVISVSGFVLTLLLLLVAPSILPRTISVPVVFFAAVADLFFYRIIDTSGQAFQSVLWLSQTAILNVLPSITRILAGLVLIYCFPQPTALEWTALYMVSTAVAAAIALLMVHRSLGQPRLALKRLRPELLEGFYFSMGLSSQTIYNDIDKTMLARLSSLDAAGIYAAAYRLIDVAFVPVRSLLTAAYAKFFQHGASGIKGSLVLAKQLIPFAGAYSIAASLGLCLLAPLIPYALGDEYAGTVNALRWLAPLTFIKSMHYFAADSLTGAGFQGHRSAVQVLVAIVNILLNLWLIPLFSWQGAALTSIASDGLLMLGLWFIVVVLFRRQSRKLNSPRV